MNPIKKLSIFKKNDDEHDFTKVVWKLSVKPINCPISKQINSVYEVKMEFKCPNEELETMSEMTSDTEQTLTDLSINTQFMIKSKTIVCNYEELKTKLGYEPDAVEFDAHLKKLLKQFEQQIFHQTKKYAAAS